MGKLSVMLEVEKMIAKMTMLKLLLTSNCIIDETLTVIYNLG